MSHIDILLKMIPSKEQIDKEVSYLKHFEFSDLYKVLDAAEYNVLLDTLDEAVDYAANCGVDVEQYVLQSTVAQFERYRSHLVTQEMIETYTMRGFEFIEQQEPLNASIYIQDKYTGVYYVPTFAHNQKICDIINTINPHYSNVRILGFFNGKTYFNSNIVSVLELIYYITNGYDTNDDVYNHLISLAMNTIERV